VSLFGRERLFGGFRRSLILLRHHRDEHAAADPLVDFTAPSITAKIV